MQRNITLLVLLLTASTLLWASPRRPKWVDTRPEKPLLYQGYGVADDNGSKEQDQLRADQNAKAEIIQEISSTIRSEVKSYYGETVSSGKMSETESLDIFTALSSTYADATVEGIKIADRYYDKKRRVYYSRATLSKADYKKQIAKRAKTARYYAEERFEFAQQALSNKNISLGFEHLNSALNHVLVAQSIVKQHIQGDLNGDGKMEFIDTGLYHEISTLLQNISFVLISGDGQKGERDQALSQPLTGQINYKNKGENITLKNASLQVTIIGAVAEFNSTVHTNDKGYFEVSIDKLISASTPTPSVNVNFHFPQLMLADGGDNDHPSLPESGGVNFSLKMDVAASVKIMVRILEEVNGERLTKSKSEGVMIKALISEKYKVLNASNLSKSISIDDLDFAIYYEDYSDISTRLIPHANYAVFGVISAETSSTGTLNYARASAKMNVIDLKSGRILSSGSQDNIKAAGNTEAKANKSALRKCSHAAVADIMQGLGEALK